MLTGLTDCWTGWLIRKQNDCEQVEQQTCQTRIHTCLCCLTYRNHAHRRSIACYR